MDGAGPIASHRIARVTRTNIRRRIHRPARVPTAKVKEGSGRCHRPRRSSARRNRRSRRHSRPRRERRHRHRHHDGWYVPHAPHAPSVRPSVTAAIGSKKPLLLPHPENEANGKGSRTSCKVGRQSRGKERKKRQRFVYTESTVHDSTDQTICRQEVICTTFLRFLFLLLLPKKEESLVLVES